MRRLRFIFVLIAWLAALAPAARGEAPREYQLKAAFIYNFVQFVEWPAGTFADSRTPIVLATVGDDPFQGALDKAVGGKTVSGRSLVVKHFARGTDVQGCQLIFAADGQDEQLSAALQKTGNAPMLTVGESDGFLRAGGMVRFYEEDNRLRFEINPKAASRVGLHISSRLLKLARIYNG
jgi:preprotein translocase subunit Sec61beta